MRTVYFVVICIFLVFYNSLLYSQQRFSSRHDVCSLIKEGGNRQISYSKRKFFNEMALGMLKVKNDSIGREQLYEIGLNYFNMHDLKQLKIVAQTLSIKSVEKSDENHLAQSFRLFGLYYEKRSINDSAFYFYEKAGKVFKAKKNDLELCKNYLDKAYVQSYVNDFLGSDQSLIKALKIAKIGEFKESIYLIYWALGNNSFELGDEVKAIEYYEKALYYFKINGLKKDTTSASCEVNIATSLSNLEEFDKSVQLFQKILQQTDLAVKSPTTYCFVLDNFAKTKFKMGQFDKIENYYLKASKIRDSLRIEQGSNLNQLYLSEYYAATKDSAKAKKFAHKAYELSKSFRAPKDMLLCLKQLAKVEPKNALKYSQDYIRISDSMQQLERESRNKFAKIAYETEEITNEKEAAVHQKWIFLGVSVLILIIAVLLYVTFSQRAKQKELQFLQGQQKSDEEIYQLIQVQQAKIDEGRSMEKKRIARDLHDGIMNRLASTRLNLHKLSEVDDANTVKKSLPFIAGIQDIEKEIRNIAHDLNKDIFINTDSFRVIVESLFSEQKKLFKTKCHFEVDKSINWDLIESNKKIHIYRIMQEALNNINKHAYARNIIASIHDRENDVLLEIYDDGVGFSFNEKKKGIGLQNIFSRTKAFNGAVDIISDQGAGTTLIITIPKKPQIKEPDNGNTC